MSRKKTEPLGEIAVDGTNSMATRTDGGRCRLRSYARVTAAAAFQADTLLDSVNLPWRLVKGFHLRVLSTATAFEAGTLGALSTSQNGGPGWTRTSNKPLQRRVCLLFHHGAKLEHVAGLSPATAGLEDQRSNLELHVRKWTPMLESHQPLLFCGQLPGMLGQWAREKLVGPVGSAPTTLEL